MRKNIFCLAVLGLSLCVSSEYFIEISPNSQPVPYQMKLGEVRNFEAIAYRKEGSASSPVSLEDKVWWEYEKMLLEKVTSGKASIELKAIREGVAALTATAIIKNNNCQKKINLLITK